MELIVFNDSESEVIGNCEFEFKQRDNIKALERLNNKVNALFELAKAISQYSSIFQSFDVQGNKRSADTLIESLCSRDEIEELINIPMKAVLGKGFLIAKINLFNMLLILSNPIPELRKESIQMNKDISDMAYTLLAEEVFIALIEDHNVDEDIRRRAAFLLANVWEYRLNHGVQEFAPILNSLWEARKNLRPVFGTMMGTFEMLRIAENMDPLWLDFIQDDSTSNEVFQALEEFLFSLSYEDLTLTRDYMNNNALNTLKKDDIQPIIGRKQTYKEVNESDPREMYHFFKCRKNNADYRRRANISGPKKTIEEHIMAYILLTTQWTGK